MGKYSLDAFERYPLVKLRPAVAQPENECYRLVKLTPMAPKNGDWPDLPDGEGENVILKLDPDGRDLSGICGFVRRTGAACAGGRQLAGVVLTDGGFTGVSLEKLVRAYLDSFHAAVLLAEPGSEAAEACRREGIPFGLWLDLKRGILPLRRGIGQNSLARIWEKCPVYLYAGRKMAPEELDAARRWHCTGADVPAPLGPRMTLRRMMFPRDLTAGGVMPLRMWWQNLGTAPLYRNAEIVLELRSEGKRFAVSVTGEMKRPGLGDSTFNTTAALPRVPCGIYELWCGLCSGGKLLPLAMDAPEDRRVYRVGSVTLDDIPRPYLKTMWEEQYADGYYPLEDPAQPE